MTSEDDGGETADLARAKDVESILSLCNARGVPGEMLRWHYRSRHQSLIKISNDAFYDGRLLVIPSPRARTPELGLSLVRVEGGVGGLGLGHEVLDVVEAIFKGPSDGRSVEDQVADLAPAVVRRELFDDADAGLEALAAHPQLTVERLIGKPGGEPGRRVVLIAEARDEALAVPIGAHAVELFAHPPAGEIDVGLPNVGEEHGRRFAVSSGGCSGNSGLGGLFCHSIRTPGGIVSGGLNNGQSLTETQPRDACGAAPSVADNWVLASDVGRRPSVRRCGSWRAGCRPGRSAGLRARPSRRRTCR